MTRIESTKNTCIEAKKKKITWKEYVGAEKYEHQIYRLQDEAGLTFKEARAVLTPYPVFEELTEEWGCTKENIFNLIRYGMKKVEKIAGDDEDKIEDLVPSRMSHIM